MEVQEGATALKENTDVWILKYYPLLDPVPVFLLWYTDTDKESTDKLFTFKTGQIFATNSLNDLKNIIVQNYAVIKEFENLNVWLNDFDSQVSSKFIIYDINKIYNAVKVQNFEIEILEGLTNFINLFGDYVHQDHSNKNLKLLVDNKSIRKAWDYYYNYVFWPRFNDKDRFEAWERPPFKVNVVKLIQGLEKLIRCFEDKITIIN
ncbi:hypothetical protein SAMN05421820_11551 [Pedobacter steynii]|uniref:Uncharacterized protein n=1 Tax=Pedobacter steynii TaxID=430522 RepID=A0A1H0JRT4_9SPHI|nr:hypothetical protein [Pedobacter steynii]NQX43142.1 hypothetical protein [Pedobacter steynii]SDO46250.1 hypothetical protein SAMN05421820_11551 [Pedobacter steynii]